MRRVHPVSRELPICSTGAVTSVTHGAFAQLDSQCSSIRQLAAQVFAQNVNSPCPAASRLAVHLRSKEHAVYRIWAERQRIGDCIQQRAVGVYEVVAEVNDR
jgi:hypothetical protein